MGGFQLDIELPDELLPFRGSIESTIKPYLEIKARRENNLALWESKFGGLPYLPKGVAYPRDSKGSPLFLLAQINFAECPGLETFPDSGILQFYISDDGLYGLSLDDLTRQDSFRIQYFPEVIKDESQLQTDFGFLPRPNICPLEGSCSLTYSARNAPISVYDYQFANRILGKDLTPWSDEVIGISSPYEKLFPSLGHQIGGYPFFTQSDPRHGKKYKRQDYVLLFQMDTDYEAGIMWGDAGVGSFFIREPDLRRRDFSKVLYSWDCG